MIEKKFKIGDYYTIYWQVVINPNESIFKRSYVNEMASNCSNIGSFIKLTDKQVKALKTTITTFIDSIKI